MWSPLSWIDELSGGSESSAETHPPDRLTSADAQMLFRDSNNPTQKGLAEVEKGIYFAVSEIIANFAPLSGIRAHALEISIDKDCLMV